MQKSTFQPSVPRDLNSENRKLIQKVSQLEKEVTKWKMSHEEAVRLNSKLSTENNMLWTEKFFAKNTAEKTIQAEKNLKNLKAEFAALEISAKNLRAQNADFENFAQLVKTLKIENEKLKRENSNFEKKISKAQDLRKIILKYQPEVDDKIPELEVVKSSGNSGSLLDSLGSSENSGKEENSEILNFIPTSGEEAEMDPISPPTTPNWKMAISKNPEKSLSPKRTDPIVLPNKPKITGKSGKLATKAFEDIVSYAMTEEIPETESSENAFYAAITSVLDKLNTEQVTAVSTLIDSQTSLPVGMSIFVQKFLESVLVARRRNRMSQDDQSRKSSSEELVPVAARTPPAPSPPLPISSISRREQDKQNSILQEEDGSDSDSDTEPSRPRVKRKALPKICSAPEIVISDSESEDSV